MDIQGYLLALKNSETTCVKSGDRRWKLIFDIYIRSEIYIMCNINKILI